MQSVLILLTLLGLTSAIPKPQLIDTEGVAAAPDPVLIVPSYDVLEEAGATNEPAIAPRNRLHRRDGTCALQPGGSGPVSSPDTPDAFSSNPVYSALAENAPVPDGYSIVMRKAPASLSASKYMGLRTLKSYDTLGCASLCDQAPGCQAFNMYVERDPSLDPNTVSCPDPPSITNFKCTLWGATVSAAQATNKGQWRASFQIVITGSNAYNKVSPPSAIACYTGPAELGGAMNAPYNVQGQNTYMGYKFHAFSQTQGYDPSTCAVDCNAQTAYNKRHPAADGSYQTCVFFNAYVLSMNGVPQGLYCSMYTQVWAASYATNYGQYRDTDRYTVSRSYSYSLNLMADGSSSCDSTTTMQSSFSGSSTSQPTVAQTTTTSSGTAQPSKSVTTQDQNTSASVESSEETSPAIPIQTATSFTVESQTVIVQPTTTAEATVEPTTVSESGTSPDFTTQLNTSHFTGDITSSTSSTSSVLTTSTSSTSSTPTATSTFSITTIADSSTSSTITLDSTASTPSSTPLANFCLQSTSTNYFASLSKGGNGLAYFDASNSKNLPSLFTLDSSSRLISTKTKLFAMLNIPTFGPDGFAPGHIEGVAPDQLDRNPNQKPLVCGVGSGFLVCRSAANYIDPMKSPEALSQVYTVTEGNLGVERFVFAPTTALGTAAVKVLPASACGPNYS
ncbi:MAG: hypothetical protein L6R36_002727 [Xanthoria steineri]|nr:MAG: hypothetical protein L6R36_002727 [Xanthoria steineri]